MADEVQMVEFEALGSSSGNLCHDESAGVSSRTASGHRSMDRSSGLISNATRSLAPVSQDDGGSPPPRFLEGTAWTEGLEPEGEEAELQTVQPEEFKVLESSYVEWCAKKPPGWLDKRLHVNFRTIWNMRSELYKIYCSQSPASTLMCVRWFQAIAVALCIYFALISYLRWIRIDDSVRITHRAFRFTVLEVRGDKPVKASASREAGDVAETGGSGVSGTHEGEGASDGSEDLINLHSWGLLLDGCQVNATGVSLKGSQFWSIDFKEPTTVNGFWIKTSEEGRDRDPISFQVDGSEDGVEWSVLSRNSRCMFKQHAEPGSLVPQERLQLRLYDWSEFRCQWPNLIVHVLDLCCRICGTALAVTAGFFGRGRLATLCFAGGFTVSMIGNIVGFSELIISRGEVHRLVEGLVAVFVPFFWPVSLIWSEAFAFELAAVSIGIWNLSFAKVLWDRRFSEFPHGLFILFVLSLLLLWRRETIRSRARKEVSEDKGRFDKAWADVLGRELDSLRHLKDLTEFLGGVSANDALDPSEVVIAGRLVDTDEPVLQLQGSQPDMSYLGLARNSPEFAKFASEWRAKSQMHCLRWKSATVDSLDALYIQSTLLLPIFRFKCLKWAVVSVGYLRSRAADAKTQNPDPNSCASFVHAADLVGDQLLQKVCFTRQKPIDRALQKLAQSYGNSVARLLDITRECLCFDTVANLRKCLLAIYRDIDVVILRIRNKMDPQSESLRTAGWRFVSIIFRISNDITRRLGVDGHCAELLLALKPLAILPTDAQHARYIVFRECAHYRSLPSIGHCCRFMKNMLKGRRLEKLPCSRASSYVLDEEFGPRHGSRHSLLHNLSSSCSMRADIPSPDSVRRGSSQSGAASPSGSRASFIRRSISGSTTVPPLKIYIESDLVEEQNVFQAMTSVMVQRCFWYDGLLQRMVQECRHSFDKVRMGSIFDSPTPVTLAFSMRPFWAFFLLSSVGTFCFDFLPTMSRSFDGEVSSQHFRFVLHECWPASCNLNATSPDQEITFGLLRAGCDVVGHLMNTSVDEKEVLWTYSTAVSATAFWVRLGDHNSDHKPIHFELQSWTDQNSWQPVSVNGCNHFQNSSRFKPAHCWHRATKVRWESGEVRTLSFGSSWSMLLRLPAVPCICMGNMIAILLAMSGRPSLSKHACASGFYMGFIMFVVSAVVESLESENDVDGSVFWMLASFPVLALGYFVQSEMFPIPPLLAVLYSNALDVVFEVVSSDQLTSITLPWGGALIASLIVVLLFLRQRLSVSVRRQVQTEKSMYDRVWQEIAQQESTSLSHLATAIKGIPTSSMEPLQYSIRRNSSLSSMFLRHGRAEVIADVAMPSSPPLRSLDHLYSIASVARVILQEKVQSLAGLSNGSFAINGDQNATVRWEDAREDSQVLKKIAWAPLKSVDRAVEKVNRCYQQNPSKLLDISREAVIFENVEDLLKCVQAIQRDSSVEVVRVKNKMTDDYDAWQTIGFRSVQFNLRLVTEETIRLGIDAFVHELQLILQAVWVCKTTAGHQAYKTWRNYKAA